MRRRRYLASLAAGTALLAGCSGSGSSPTPTRDSSEKMDRFERNLKGIPDPQLSREGDVVTLNYSVEEVNRTEIRSQTRSVAIAWSQVVGAGWDAERVDVTVTAGDTVILTYHIEAEWADQWNNRSISPDEYEAYINETVETASPTASG